MTSEIKPVAYNDLYFRIIISLIAAHIIVTFGAKESLFLLLISWFYYRSLILSFVIAFLLISGVYLATIKLDKHYDWQRQTAKRIGLQAVFGLVLPSVCAFLLAAVYFGIFGYNILDTYYLRFDFPVIVIMLILLNIYYLAFYFYKRGQYFETRLRSAGISVDAIDGQKNKEVIVVQEGNKNIPLLVESICYFYHDGHYNFVRTNDREDFIIAQTLDEMQLQLSDKQFFRVNRQMLVNFTACQHYEPIEYGKLKLLVTPVTKEPVIVSQKKARLFKEWIGR
jgi:hypothetical protein